MVIITLTIVIKEGEHIMRKPRKRSFSDLVNENKRQLLNDQEAIERIEKRLEKKHMSKAQ